MRILLTNDDGYGSEGLSILRGALERDHEVFVSAPDSDRSGRAHAITLKDAIRVRRIDERKLVCYGTPADCVFVALLGAFDGLPELVLSGINHGPNIGTDILYSGTAAAARQAALMGVPAVAVSLATLHPPFHFGNAVDFIVGHLEEFVARWDERHFFNVNVPNSDQRLCDVKITRPSPRRYQDRMRHFAAPDGKDYYFLEGEPIDGTMEAGSDWDAVARGFISVSPLSVEPAAFLPTERERYAFAAAASYAIVGNETKSDAAHPAGAHVDGIIADAAAAAAADPSDPAKATGSADTAASAKAAEGRRR